MNRMEMGDHGQRGVTMTELLIVLALMVLILTAVTSIFKEGLVGYSRDITEVGVQLDTRLAVEKIRRDIRTSQFGYYEGDEYPYTDEDENKLYLLVGSRANPRVVAYYFENGTVFLSTEGSNEPFLKDVESFIPVADPSENPSIVKVKLEYSEQPQYQQNSITKELTLLATPRVSTN